MIDKSYLDQISVKEFTTYLISLGWRLKLVLGETSSVWQNESYPDDEFILPRSKELRDANKRLHQIIKELSELFGKTEFEIFNEITAGASDVVKIRVIHPDVTGGVIPIHDGVLLFEKAYELITAATRSTVEKRRYFTGRVAESLNQFLQGINFGQTERGSYIVSLITSLSTQQSEQVSHSNQSFTRSVTSNLSRGLLALNKAKSESIEERRDEVFESLVEYGVSANLCDALIGLTGSEKKRNVNIDILLGQSEPVEDEIELTHSFGFQDVPFLEEASKYYKEIAESTGQTICGYVKRLHREDNGFCEITIEAAINGINKSVTLELEESNYWEAHAAHKAGKLIECHGDLILSPRSAKLNNVSNFRVFGNENLFTE